MAVRNRFSTFFTAFLVAWLVARIGAFAAPANDFDKYFSWNNEQIDPKASLPTWPRDEVTYTSLGKLSLENADMVDTYMNAVAKATGLKFKKTIELPANITFISEDSVIHELHDLPQKFRTLGFTDTMIVTMQIQNPRPKEVGGLHCGTANFTTEPNNELGFSVVLMQSVAEKCIMMGAFAAVGVNSGGDPATKAEALKYACILYEGRRIGAHTVGELTEKRAQIEAACQKKSGK